MIFHTLVAFKTQSQVAVRGSNMRFGAPWRRRLDVRLKGEQTKVEQVAASLGSLGEMELERSGLGLKHPAHRQNTRDMSGTKGRGQRQLGGAVLVLILPS